MSGVDADAEAAARPPADSPYRIALYYVPESDEPLARAAADWLAGRVIDEPWPGWLDAPRRYGFHATLKAPFRVADGHSAEALAGWALGRAAGRASVPLPPLAPVWFDGFLALRPTEGDPGADSPLRCLADEWVAALDAWRAPLGASERARRRPERLTDVERRHLDRWGYPFVFETWRFHMTLSGPVPADMSQVARASVLDAAARHFGPALRGPLHIGALNLCAEPEPGAPFVRWRRLPLAGG